MKPALVVVSFGTSVPTARENIVAAEQVIRDCLPDADFFRAFTSPTIRRILQGRGETIFSLEETLRLIEQQGYTEVYVQPTHFLYGTEYDRMAATARSYRGRFHSLHYGDPLLSHPQALERLASCIMQDYPVKDGEALVLFGHGTLHFANTTYPALQPVFHIRHREDILVGTAEGWPTLQDIREELKNGSYRSVHLVPVMLVNGDHVMNDLNGDGPDSWRSILESDGYKVTCTARGLGLVPAVQEMYRDHTESLLRGENHGI